MFGQARWRLSIWFALVVAVILLVIGVAVYATTQRVIFSQVNNDLESRAHTLVRNLEPGPGVRLPPGFTAGGYFYALATADGSLRKSTDVELQALGTAGQITDAARHGPRFIDTSTSDDENLRVYLLPVRQGGTDYILEVGRSVEPQDQALRRLLIILLVGGGAGLLLAVGGGFMLAGRALKPIQTAMDRQRGFVADASHELRTPLTLIRANAELLKRQPQESVQTGMESVDDIIQETDRLSSLVSQMLTLARSDSHEAPLELADVNMSAVAEDVVGKMQLLARPRQIGLSLSQDGAARVRGDETRLRELLMILVDNAIKYTDEGGHVTVDVRPHDQRVVLHVSDNGQGIPPEALEHVFDRFYRADKARSREMGGTGLGLSIARWIAESHNGSISLESTPGRGTTATIDLPAAG